MKFGYARIRPGEPKTEIQLDAFRAYGVDIIFEVKTSGGRKRHPQLHLLLSRLHAGDSLVVYDLKCLGRYSKQLLVLIQELSDIGVDFVSLAEQIGSSTPMGRFILNFWRALVQLDRDSLPTERYHTLL